MNWGSVSFDWNQVRAFIVTAEEGSLSRAARVLETTQPTIGRQVSALEASLEVTLFERSVRGLSLTEAGRDLLEHARAMGEGAMAISLRAARQSQDVTGEVTITATHLMSAAVLPKLLEPLRELAPALRLRIICTNDLKSLLQRDADIAIRNVRPDRHELFARRVGHFRGNLYASTAYLDRAGRPRTAREVADHTFVGSPDPQRLLAPIRDRGIPVRAESFVVSSDSGAVVWELVKQGYGISLLPETLCEPEPGIEKVLPSFTALEFPIWLVTHRELQTSPKIRIVFDELARGFRRTLEAATDDADG